MNEEKKIAKEMVDEFTSTTHPISRIMVDGKQCALICVKWIVKEINLHYATRRHYRNQVLLKWEKVRQEILLRR